MKKKWFWVLLAVSLALALACVAQVVMIGREASHRTDGEHDLRNIGMALEAYQQLRGALPRGTVSNASLPPERRLSWLAVLASYWDIGGLYNAINWDESWNSSNNVRLAKLNYLTNYRAYYGYITNKGLTPYVGIAGLGVDSPQLPNGHPRAGAFGYDRITSARDFKDGLATTMIVAETARAYGPWLAGGPSTVRGVDSTSRPYIGKGRQFGSVGHSGALALMADGSVRSLRASIDPKVFEALSTVAGNEPLPSNWEW
jgi:hypothetical protein